MRFSFQVTVLSQLTLASLSFAPRVLHEISTRISPVTRQAKEKIKISEWAKESESGGAVLNGEYLSADEVQAKLRSAPQEGSSVEMESKRPMELFVKAGPGGDDLGDCPFAQCVRMVASAKGLDLVATPCVPETKPAWLVEHFEGKMPCLLHKGEAYTESMVIARYLDFFFPTPANLFAPESADPAVAAATAALFPAVAKYLKNTVEAEDEVLAAGLEDALGELDAHLAAVAADAEEEGAGAWLAGGACLGVDDCALAPKLHHLVVAGKHYKGFEVPAKFISLQAYVDAAFAHPAFIATAPPDGSIVWGWGNAREG